MKKLFGLGAALFLVSSISAAAPTLSPVVKNEPPAAARSAPRPKATPKLTAQQTLGVAGDKRPISATLTGLSTRPLAGKKIAFKLEGKHVGNGPVVGIPIGSASTDEQGKATVEWMVPELRKDGLYKIVASWDGDDEYTVAKDDAIFTAVPCITKFELKDLVYGSLDPQGGTKFSTIFVILHRGSDQQALAKPIWIDINGDKRKVNDGTNPEIVMSFVLPSTTHQWKVTTTFDADATYQGTSATRTYSHN